MGGLGSILGDVTGGVGSFLGFLSQGQTPPATTSSNVNVASTPMWYQSYLSSLAGNAASVASSPYQMYPGARIAPLDQQEQQAYNFVGDNATNWQQPLASGTNAASSVAGGFDPQQFNSYLSPYVGGVANEIGRLGQQNLTENLLPTLNDQFVSSGQYGSDRNRTMDERLVRDVGANISGQQGSALNTAFNSAEQNYNTGQYGRTGAANALGGLAQADQALTAGTAGTLAASGATQRQFGQSNLDLAYQDFQNQVNYPRQNVSFLSSALNGANVPTSQDETKTAPFAGSMSPSPLATFAALYLGNKGINGGTGTGTGAGIGTTPQANRSGGYVKRYARGGMVPRPGGLQLASVSQLPVPTPRVPMRSRARMAMPRGGLEMAMAA